MEMNESRSSKKDITDLNETSIQRKISSLKSLFKYLAEITEDEITGDSIIRRNIMNKYEMTKPKDVKTRAAAISSKISHGDQDKNFLIYMASEYEDSIKGNSRKLTAFHKNKERDLAILTLFLVVVYE